MAGKTQKKADSLKRVNKSDQILALLVGLDKKFEGLDKKVEGLDTELKEFRTEKGNRSAQDIRRRAESVAGISRYARRRT